MRLSVVAVCDRCDVTDSDRLEHQLEEAVTLRQDYESSASKLKTLEKQVKTLRQEKDEVHKVVLLSERRVVMVILCVLMFSSSVSSSWPTLWSV